jgi:hypothetical protein
LAGSGSLGTRFIRREIVLSEIPTRVLAWEISLQYRRNPARCRRTKVSGVTMMVECFQADQPSDYPEELIEDAKARARMPALQHGELLT